MGITDKIRDAGVVGAGGAGFPTHVKINCKADVVLANGAECEPLLRVDQQVMQCYAQEIVEGVRLVMRQTGAKEGVIALKGHYKDAISALEREIGGAGDVRLCIMKSYYPAGDEQQIVYEVTGRVVPTGGLPLDVGAVVCNVSTLADITNAQKGIPVTEKYVTVGGAVARPCTVKVPVGAAAAGLVEYAGGTTEACSYIVGGPCMGAVSESLDFPVTKTTGGILAIPKGHYLLSRKDDRQSLQLIQAACCQCSYCTQMCPRNALGLNVAPHKAMRAVANGLNLLEDANGTFSCCDCGICTYQACNFGLKPHKIMSQMKAGLLRAGVKARKEVYTAVDSAFDMKKLPVSRLISRLGIKKYDVPAPIRHDLLDVKTVRIPLKMHVGAPAVPVVEKGRMVGKGDLVADIREGALGARVHASITGRVTGVTDGMIIIEA
jgi:Na+-translocating ferredoxin:NAD+ oxidoreductase RnfC subunit